MANNYNINYNDKRFQQVESEKQQALTEAEKTYGGMINESDKYYQAQIDATKQWAETQKQNQQAQTDFAIEKVEQQKEQANKDYLKEQSGAYVDWQKESNRYGANAEQMATAGLINTGYGESSQVTMYNTYQNRVATARESYNKAILNYENAIKEAQLQNNSVLAEIAYQSLQKELELSLQGFQYKNQLVLDLSNKKQEIDNNYYSRYQDVLNQINHENALAEQIRQYNQNYDLQLKQYNESVRQYNQNYALQQKQLEEEKRQFNATMSAKSSGGSSGGSSGKISSSKGSSSSGGNSSVSKENYAVNTAYYKGSLNSDAKKYGTFSNGYQPKGISGHGTLSKTGDTITFNTKTLSGQKQIVTQNIWKAKDGTKWYWDGRYNKYIKVK